jgi:hypothetical protein
MPLTCEQYGQSFQFPMVVDDNAVEVVVDTAKVTKPAALDGMPRV